MSLAVTSFVAATSAPSVTSLAAFFFLPADSFASADSWTTVSAFASAVSVTGAHPLDYAISISAVVRLAACLFPPVPTSSGPFCCARRTRRAWRSLSSASLHRRRSSSVSWCRGD
ncbi:hypothetical protein PF001_g33584, partial [Phytophthora fragariae]